MAPHAVVPRWFAERRSDDGRSDKRSYFGGGGNQRRWRGLAMSGILLLFPFLGGFALITAHFKRAAAYLCETISTGFVGLG